MIFVAHFLHVSHQQESSDSDRRHGAFHMMIDAEDQEAARARFRERLEQIGRGSGLFEGACRIYLTRMLQFEQPPKNHAVMFSFQSMAGDPVMPYIGCSSPSGETDGCEIIHWEDNVPVMDEQPASPFFSFSAQ
ncbi:MAG: hypothetical protein ACLFRG_13275 [Desulfococcaceae bacterium]